MIALYGVATLSAWLFQGGPRILFVHWDALLVVLWSLGLLWAILAIASLKIPMGQAARWLLLGPSFVLCFFWLLEFAFFGIGWSIVGFAP